MFILTDISSFFSFFFFIFKMTKFHNRPRYQNTNTASLKKRRRIEGKANEGKYKNIRPKQATTNFRDCRKIEKNQLRKTTADSGL